MYFNRCELCGAYLDPGERCDCRAYKPEPARIIPFPPRPAKERMQRVLHPVFSEPARH